MHQPGRQQLSHRRRRRRRPYHGAAIASPTMSQVTGYAACQQHICRQMSDLAPEWLQQILDYVSVRDLHRACLRVNTEWHWVTKQALKERTSIKIVGTWYDEDLLDSPEVIIVSHKTDVRSLQASLLSMTGIKELDVSLWSNVSAEPVILGKADMLTKLQCLYLPIGEGIVYPKLRSLRSTRLSKGTGAACPRLLSLKTSTDGSAEALDALPAERMRELDVTLVSHRPSAMVQVVDRLLTFRNLTKMRFCVKVLAFQDKETLLRLFTGFTQLKTFTLLFWADDLAMDASQVAKDLLQQNPGLEEFRVHGFSLSDQTMAHFASLEHMRVLSITANDAGVMTYVMPLLRGQSRHRLRNIAISLPDGMDVAAIRVEAETVARERGVTVAEEMQFSKAGPVFDITWT